MYIAVLIIFALIGFFIYLKVKQAGETKIRNKNKRQMVNEICNLARAGEGYWAISSSVGQCDHHASVFIHRPSGAKDRYGFQEHGYALLDYRGIVALFHEMAAVLQGYVNISYREVYGAGSDAVSSVSSAFTPGGGTGYQVNTCGGGGSATVPTGISLFSPEETKRRRLREQAAEAESAKRRQYKKTF